MILDLTVSNFRSFKEEQTLSMVAEHALNKHTGNFRDIEDGRYSVLKSAAIFGPNAAGKSNIIRAIAAVRWLVLLSENSKEGETIPPYEPFRLATNTSDAAVAIEIEFVVHSGARYRYEISFEKNRIVTERLTSFTKRSRAIVFEREDGDNWETMKLGGTYRGGTRRFPFFDNVAYLSRAGNDASAAPFIREIYRYFQRLTYVSAGGKLTPGLSTADESMVKALSELIRLADTGVNNLTVEEDESVAEIRFPDDIPESVRASIIADNKRRARYWIQSPDGAMIDFDEDDMSSGTIRLVELLPVVLHAFRDGSPVVIDELDANLHTDIVLLLLSLFHDADINPLGAQLIFTTHDTNILDPERMRRDQIWFVSKSDGISTLRSLDEYERKLVRHDSPFESFYRDGRLGALPNIALRQVKRSLVSSLNAMIS